MNEQEQTEEEQPETKEEQIYGWDSELPTTPLCEI